MNSIRFSNAIAFVLISLSHFCGLRAATFTITNNNDSGVGSLRQAILDVNASGDATNEIVVALSGTGNSTILLQSELPAINNQVRVNGSDQNSNETLTIDGSIAGDLLVGLEVNGAAASDTSIKNLGIQNITNDASSAYGIFITNEADGCSVINTIITSISSSADFARGIIADSTTIMRIVSYNTVNEVASSVSSSIGININTIMGNCVSNIVTEVSSPGSSVGINIQDITGNCTSNTVTGLSAFTCSGISIGNISGNCVNNTVSEVSASFLSAGIVVTTNTENSLISCNTVLRITGSGAFVSGIQTLTGDNLIIQSNVIDSVENTDGAAYGLAQLGLGGAITNSLVSFNTISNIIGSSNNGFGISFENEDSIGNDLLNNSIFDINGKAINIVDNGAPVDARVVLTSVRCASGCKLIIEGSIMPLINAPQFKLQFFVSDSKTPEQTKTFIAEEVIDTPSDLFFRLRLTGLPPITAGQFITATATALPAGAEENNNTSEVSNALLACDPNTPDGICQCAPEALPQLPLCPVITSCNV